ncbi:hypothetical protein L5M38_16400 [Shewanella sp. SM101]|uniref:hypothetical protein n=1 Tax=Shewanella sp. SM101 TaxID=2912789 RepID=UPI0021D8F76E|nr:hypothetical protein [Shewanella sp. SM101]MCU8106106.1 hypothetical protein [Shewanella sp. SM101]
MVLRRFILLILVLSLAACQNHQAKTQTQTRDQSVLPKVELHNEIQPLVLIVPSYPQKALERQITGNCRLSFDLKSVDHGSKPFNIKVVHCENEDIFWNTSVSALNMWLYSGIKKITEYSKEPTNGLEATFKYQLSDVQQ